MFEFIYKVPALHAIIDKEHRDELVNHYMETISTVLTKMGYDRVDETIEEIKSELHRCNILQIWYVMFLAVYHLEVCNAESEADAETLSNEENWLKIVLDELLDLENDLQ